MGLLGYYLTPRLIQSMQIAIKARNSHQMIFRKWTITNTLQLTRLISSRPVIISLVSALRSPYILETQIKSARDS